MIVNLNQLICSLLSIVSLIMIYFVLALSTRPTTTKAHLGTKIFVVNLMLIEMVHASCQLYIQTKQALPELLLDPWLELIGFEAFDTVSRWTVFLRAMAFTIFPCSMIPMTTMSILACYRPQTFTGKTAAKYFAGLVLAADLIPVAFVLVCKLLRELRSDAPLAHIFKTERSIDYMILYFTLYFSEVSLAALSLWTLYAKSVQLAGTNATIPAITAARRNLRLLVMFSIAPALVQIPYATNQIVGAFAAPQFKCMDRCESDSCKSACGSFWANLNFEMMGYVDLVFALKPIIDATSALLFLGEYRKNASAILRRLRWCFEELLPSQPTTIHFTPSAYATNTVSPS